MPRNIGANFEWQEYKGIHLRLIDRDYTGVKAKRYVLQPFSEGSASNQNVWIPSKHLLADGTIRPDEDIDYVFRTSSRQLELAGYVHPIIGIKRTTVLPVQPSYKQRQRSMT